MNRRNKRLNWDDYEWVRDHCTTCAEVGVEVGSQVDLKQDGIEFPGAVIFGVTSNMSDIEDKVIADGRFISPDEVQRSAYVCVLGSEIKEKFFPNTEAVGRDVKVRGVPMRVVGIEEPARFWRFARPARLHSSHNSYADFGVTGCRFTEKPPSAKLSGPSWKMRASRCASSTGLKVTRTMTLEWSTSRI
jgi:hypothetical protein